MANEVSITVYCSIKTCGNCGFVFTIPNYVTFCPCPKCLDRMYDKKCEENLHLQKVNAGLRGELKKRRNNEQAEKATEH